MDESTHEAAGRVWLITGATGFIGGHLIRALQARGDQIIALARNPQAARQRLDARVQIVGALSELHHDVRIDGVVNLAGARIIGMPWTEARRRVLRSSRIDTTEAIVRLCARLAQRPRVLVSGSAIGYYGVRGDELVDESAQPQTIFQSQLCREWEAAAMKASDLGVRVACIRTGVVFGADGGALPQLALPVRLYAGVVLGDGAQWLSWIHIDDLVRLLVFALDDDRCTGAINGTAPEPVRYSEFYRLLGGALHRPIWLRVPATPIRAALGEMSQMLVDGQRVVPARALALGFQFHYPAAQTALRDIYAVAERRSA